MLKNDFESDIEKMEDEGDDKRKLNENYGMLFTFEK